MPGWDSRVRAQAASLHFIPTRSGWVAPGPDSGCSLPGYLALVSLASLSAAVILSHSSGQPSQQKPIFSPL